MLSRLKLPKPRLRFARTLSVHNLVGANLVGANLVGATPTKTAVAQLGTQTRPLLLRTFARKTLLCAGQRRSARVKARTAKRRAKVGLDRYRCGSSDEDDRRCRFNRLVLGLTKNLANPARR